MTTPFNRVKFTPVAGGTADFVVSAAVTGYSTPAQRGVPTGTVVSYTAESADLAQWETGIGTYTSGTTTLARTTVRENSLGTAAKINFSAAPSVWIDWHAQELSNFVAPIGETISLTTHDAVVADTDGPNVTITAGDGAGTLGDGGDVIVHAGNIPGAAVAPFGSSGSIIMYAGYSTTTDFNGRGGSFYVFCGDGNPGTWPNAGGDGGYLGLYGGTTVAGQGGHATFAAGHGHYGGNLTLYSGDASYYGDGGETFINSGTGQRRGGHMYLRAGNSSDYGVGGNLQMRSGLGGPNDGGGGRIQLYCGNALANTNDGGTFSASAGAGKTSGAGGYVFFEAGAGGTSGNGGTLYFYAGKGNGGGDGGHVIFYMGLGTPQGQLKILNLPTADPTVTDAIFSKNNVLMKSGVTNFSGTITSAGLAGAGTGITVVNGIITAFS